ncbi:hypothetical protein BV22DRAFT_1014298 [Leucogyrophana mollusca]|uniref:Uncharacterized protein n=1 Tax=Leucogyrophana mollusca TaxID=85980 RepID=A0ACB8BDQ1_9AGAM|nr:hypothetical protein BV22DRAFT_1014298 [Leucogyrophana mollusca]
MPSLSDQIDHLVSSAKAIRTSAEAITEKNGPGTSTFTSAVLNTPLGDLIRDIDSSELGLFTIVQPTRPAGQAAPEVDARGVRKGEISRVEFPGATPLRKPPSRRDEVLKPADFEPEVYAQAALKYLDRYQSIRPMPRARSQVLAIIEQLDDMRDNIRRLNETLQQVTSTGPTSVPISRNVSDEENRIQYLQDRLRELRREKENMLRTTAEVRSQSGRAKPAPKARPPPEPEPQEDMFWNTPAASARTLRFTDNLLNEEVDLGDVSVMSFTSPVPPPRSMLTAIGDLGNSGGDRSLDGPEDVADPRINDSMMSDADANDDSIFAPTLDGPDEEEDGNDEGEPTVVLKKAPESPPSTSPSLVTEGPIGAPPGVSTPPHPASTKPSESAKKPKVRVNNEMERIVGKIWSSVGEIIMPGHPFDTTGGNGTKPPRAKETLAHLQSLSSQEASPASPTGSSLSSLATTAPPSTGQPTTQQILIAHLLLTLLSAQPSFSMPLSRLKEALAEKVGGAAGGTRALYGCVAKKLIRIERGGGEQVVKFDA